MKRFSIITPFLRLLTAAACATGISCSGSPDIDDNPPLPDTEATLNITQKSVDFEESAGSQSITVRSNREWTFAASDEWIHGTREDNRLVISVDENQQMLRREGHVEVSVTEQLSQTITVRQLGWGKDILLSAERATVSGDGGTVEIGVTTNFEVAAECDADWISENTASRAHPVETHVRTFTVRYNAGSKSRSAVITFSEAAEGESDFTPQKFTVTQSAVSGDFKQNGADELEMKVSKVTITGGEASSTYFGIGNSFDGSMSSYYYIGREPIDQRFPLKLTYFVDNESIDYMIYRPGTGYDSAKPYFGKVEIYALTDANTRAEDEWEFVMEHDFGQKSDDATIEFPKPLVGVKAIQFVVQRNSSGIIAIAEMEFYRRNPDAVEFDWASLFTDRSCSQLREGVGEEDIERCGYAFYRNIACYLYQNRYPAEFRIGSYDCYPHPDMQARLNKTTPYSLLDNPTGIAVSEGEEIVVLAELHGLDGEVALRVLDFSKNAGPESPREYQLVSGVNKFKMGQKGLCYIMHHYRSSNADDYVRYAEQPAVRIHFAAGGAVNGYYDKCDDALKNRGGELLGKAVHPYYDVVGRHTHLIYPTEDLRNMTGGNNLGRLLDAYDDVVYSEMELLGLVKHGGMFVNRLCFSVVNHQSFMYSTSYYTGYNAGTMGTMCSVNAFLSDTWGPSHEVGHTMQTRPGLKWAGMSECTNNIMALYVLTHLRERESRVQANNNYTSAWNRLITEQRPHKDGGTTNCLIPFWQLQLYFGDVLGRTPTRQDDRGGFYPDVYEYLRRNPDLSHGQSQANFAYVASRAAGMDLTDFFEKWGFLRETDVYVSDGNASGQLTVTKEYADDVRARIAAMTLPQPDVALEYITDNNMRLFRDRLTVAEGQTAVCRRASSTRQTRSEVEDTPLPDTSDNKFAMSIAGWQNVAAYEVRRGGADGQLVYAADASVPKESACEFVFPLPEGESWNDGYGLYAVQYDNVRHRVETRFDEIVLQ